MSATVLNIEHRLLALRAAAPFAGLPADELALLAEMMRVEHLLDGETLFNAGDLSDRVFVVVTGRLSVHLPGQPEAVRQLGPGDLLGEYGLVLHDARTASVRAVGQATLLSLDNDRFGQFLLRYPQAILELLGTTARRLIEAERRG